MKLKFFRIGACEYCGKPIRIWHTVSTDGGAYWHEKCYQKLTGERQKKLIEDEELKELLLKGYFKVME